MRATRRIVISCVYELSTEGCHLGCHPLIDGTKKMHRELNHDAKLMILAQRTIAFKFV